MAEYYFDEEWGARLESVKKRLYEGKPLSDDARRDLANTLDALMHMARLRPRRSLVKDLEDLK